VLMALICGVLCYFAVETPYIDLGRWVTSSWGKKRDQVVLAG